MEYHTLGTGIFEWSDVRNPNNLVLPHDNLKYIGLASPTFEYFSSKFWPYQVTINCFTFAILFVQIKEKESFFIFTFLTFFSIISWNSVKCMFLKTLTVYTVLYKKKHFSFYFNRPKTSEIIFKEKRKL